MVHLDELAAMKSGHHFSPWVPEDRNKCDEGKTALNTLFA